MAHREIVRSTFTVVVLHEKDSEVPNMTLLEVLKELYNGRAPGTYALSKTEIIQGEDAIFVACRGVNHDGSAFIELVPEAEAAVGIPAGEFSETAEVASAPVPEVASV